MSGFREGRLGAMAPTQAVLLEKMDIVKNKLPK